MNPYDEKTIACFDQLDIQSEMAKREIRTMFLKARRTSRQWEPRPMPEWKGHHAHAVWLDEATPVPLTRPSIDPLLR